MTLPAAWTRFSFVNAAPARPYNLHIKALITDYSASGYKTTDADGHDHAGSYATSSGETGLEGPTAVYEDLTHLCWVVSADSGYARNPVQLDSQGIYIAGAQR